MLRKYAPFLAGALVLALLAAFLLRSIRIQVDGGEKQIRAAVWTTAQALDAARVTLAAEDKVEPALDQPVPLNGQVRVTRAAQVYLWENGALRKVSGLDARPSTLLAQAGIEFGAADRLYWDGQDVDPEEALPVGRPVILQIERAHTVLLDIDGKRQEIQSTAPSVAGALWQAGVRLGPGDALSIPPGAALTGSDPLMVAYQTARPLTIKTAGQSVRARTTATTVGQALAEAGIALQGLDYSVPADDQPLPENGQVKVVRVSEDFSFKKEFIPYEKKTGLDPNLELDQQRITAQGQPGVKVIRERARFEDGREVSRNVDSDWIASEPVAETYGIGTKVVTKTTDTPDGKIEYWRAIRVYATSYSPCNQGYDHCSWSTASGMRLTKGVVGVSLAWYRMMVGQRVYIPGYGFGVIGDNGGVKGMWIDLGFDEEGFWDNAIVGWVTMYFLTPVPANIPWTLP